MEQDFYVIYGPVAAKIGVGMVTAAIAFFIQRALKKMFDDSRDKIDPRQNVIQQGQGNQAGIQGPGGQQVLGGVVINQNIETPAPGGLKILDENALLSNASNMDIVGVLINIIKNTQEEKENLIKVYNQEHKMHVKQSEMTASIQKQLNDKLEACAAHQQEISESQRQYNKDVNDLRSFVDKLKEDHELERKSDADIIAELRASLQTLQEEFKTLTENYEDLKKKYDTLKKENKSLRDQVNGNTSSTSSGASDLEE